MAPDVTVENHGTLWRFDPRTPAARQWVEDNVQVPEYMQLGRSFVCEHRCGPAIVLGMRDAGLTVAAAQED